MDPQDDATLAADPGATPEDAAEATAPDTDDEVVQEAPTGDDTAPEEGETAASADEGQVEPEPEAAETTEGDQAEPGSDAAEEQMTVGILDAWETSIPTTATVPSGATIEQALTLADAMKHEGTVVFVAKPANQDTVLEPGDVIVLCEPND